MDLARSIMYFSRFMIVLVGLGGPLEYVNAQAPSVKLNSRKFLINEDSSVHCDVTNQDQLKNRPSKLFIYKNETTLLVLYDYPYKLISLNPSSVDSRYSFSNETMTLSIKEVKCKDAGVYKCTFEYLAPGQLQKSAEETIQVIVPPSKPKELQVDPNNQTINVSSPISATCNANVGGPTPAVLRWRIYRNDVAETLSITDNRVSSQKVPIDESDESCSQRYSSLLVIQSVTVADQNLVLACFVTAAGVDPPSTCEPNDLCQQTQTISIAYPVTNIQVSKVPSGPILVGRTVTLSCKAEGFPAPTYSWSQVGSNITMGGTTEKGANKLILANVEIEKDKGTYRCTATNNYFGKTFDDSGDLTVDVVATPPPTTTPESTSTTPSQPPPAPSTGGGDDNNIIIAVVVVVVILAIIIGIVIVCCVIKKRGKKQPEPTEKPYSNQPPLSFHNIQPDLVADEKKYHASLNNSFDPQNEDGLMYADMTFDNRPRSRKPLAVGDNASEYSDVQMPQV